MTYFLGINALIVSSLGTGNNSYGYWPGKLRQMSIESCQTVALEGGPGVGKTTTALALTAVLKCMLPQVEYCDGGAWRNAFAESLAVRDTLLSMTIELHRFTAIIADQISAARFNQLLVCDKTPASVLANCRLLLKDGLPPEGDRLLHVMTALFGEWARSYDRVFILRDSHTFETEDHIHTGISGLPDIVGDEILAVFDEFGVDAIQVPRGMSLQERVNWIAGRI
ncbi:AAA family ATPase [Nocardia colli]|uniref:AAA family ATPase n=1 Tax=Nocardia colli TaxID=2545717 RepID=UPI0035D7A59D